MGQIDHAAGIADLIVIPGVDLEERAIGDHGAGVVDDRAAGIVVVVGGDQRPALKTQNPRERPGGGQSEQCIHFVYRCGTTSSSPPPTGASRSSMAPCGCWCCCISS